MPSDDEILHAPVQDVAHQKGPADAKDPDRLESEQERLISYLSETALKLLGPLSYQEIISFIADRLYPLAGGSVVIVSEFDPSHQVLLVKELRATKEEKEKITSLLGREPESLSFAFPAEIREHIRPGKLNLLENGIFELAFGQLPIAFCRNFEEALNIKTVYVMAGSVDMDLLCTVALLTHSGELSGKDRLIIESVVSQGSLALKRSRAEKSLHESSEALKIEHDILDAVIHNMDIGFFVTKPDGTVVLYNEAALEIHGLHDLEEGHGNLNNYINDFSLRRPDNSPIPVKDWPISLSFRGEFVKNMELSLTNLKSNVSRMVSISTIPVYNDSGLLQLIVFTIRDYTNIHNSTEALKESKQRYDSLFQNATTAIQQCKIITDSEGNPVDYEMFRINNTLTRITGLTEEMVYGKKATRIFPGIETSPFNYIAGFGKIALEGGELNYEAYSGKFNKWFSVYAYSPIKGEFTAFFTDITQRKQNEAELKRAKEKAEESDRLKSIFLANLSHEIRTPMNGIMGFAELLGKHDLSGKSRSLYIEAITSSSRRMLKIITDLMDISKIEAGESELKKTSFDLLKLLNEIMVLFKPDALKKNIRLLLKYELPGGEFVVETDKTKLYQVLLNLINNSLKFTPAGGTIKVGCRFKDEKTIFFSVRDTGFGIREEFKSKIFERFHQGDMGMKHEGLGLGLAIAKAYAELLGGNIGFESSQGHGSTFFFTLPSVHTLIKITGRGQRAKGKGQRAKGKEQGAGA